MRLAAFIRANIEPISVEWEQFAATLLPEQEFSSSVLRDSIADLLAEIAADMDSRRTNAAPIRMAWSSQSGIAGSDMDSEKADIALARGCSALTLIVGDKPAGLIRLRAGRPE